MSETPVSALTIPSLACWLKKTDFLVPSTLKINIPDQEPGEEMIMLPVEMRHT